MEFFNKAKTVRLTTRSKYLVAQGDKESVRQDKNGSEKEASWTVEFNDDGNSIRLRSSFGKYLTASDEPFLLGMTGNKVTQTLLVTDSSTYWKPSKHGSKLRLEAFNGNFLRGKGGLPPWRNAVVHSDDSSVDESLWDVEVLEFHVSSSKPESVNLKSIENHLEEIREVALAYYANCSNDEKSAAAQMFKSADIDGSGNISFEEFKAACLALKCPGNIDEMFQGIDTDRNGTLDFEEAITFYYMINNRMSFCRACKQYLNSTYFTCVKCCCEEKVESFNVCVTCYRRQIYFHEHKEFLDNYTMLTSVTKGKGKGSGKVGKAAAGFAGHVAGGAAAHVVVASMCSIM
ncbi:hypothetical protein ACHQM5_015278 [Ranunculus cassubicifolius]